MLERRRTPFWPVSSVGSRALTAPRFVVSSQAEVASSTAKARPPERSAISRSVAWSGGTEIASPVLGSVTVPPLVPRATV